jgi:hypothetical protein
MATNDSMPAPAPDPVPDKPEQAKEEDPQKPAKGLPPNVSFDTPAGRRAQGMDPDIGKGQPNEEGEEKVDRKEDQKEDHEPEKPGD